MPWYPASRWFVSESAQRGNSSVAERYCRPAGENPFLPSASLGREGSTFEGGIRVPAIAWWPARLAAGTECDVPTLTFDWTKTFADVAAANFPDSHAVEGVNVLSILDGQRPQRTLYWRKPRGNQIWKAVRDGDWKYIANRKADRELEYLFDLSSDEREANNLLPSRPEIAHRLRTQFDLWEETTRRNRRGRPDSF